ncbi:hypothetical protein FHX48_000044 [Microbacterium halimionae]|uniref:N-acetyltransferase domain-containing protein n=1 Tax=Microbacterium halimionae TaxID=1526413 RepID=A0A7W3PKL2_9MICO|nr:GNAT family N-acetyltransferase [Microbacterium halimionae]MBA8814992.1 hypothetical protein [Microbacterium halimionae]NII94217.1 hypothetical protein [Microbacterium halimionae]
MSDAKTTVTRNDEEQRYEIYVDGDLGGFTAFEPDDDGNLIFPHTSIDPAFKGQGLGTTLVSDALADVAQRGETVVPECSFVVRYLKENDVAGLKVIWPDSNDAQDAPTISEQSA